MTELLDRASNIMDSYIMELGGGVSAILEADGSSTVLPPNYKDLIEARRKKTMRWAEESAWVPPKMSYSRKLNIANVVKFGPSVKTICKVKFSRMSNEDVKREQKKLKNQTCRQQRQARKRAQDLLQQQQQLQARRAQMGNQYSQNMDPKRSGTPIIRNGKIVGYAVQVDSNAPKLPTVMAPISQMMPEEDWPELKDYSLLEPEVILRELDGPVNLNDKPINQVAKAQGARQVVVNGKLLTLVPFQGAPGSNPQRMATLQHRPPPGKMPISRPGGSPIVVHPSHQSLLKQRQMVQNQIRIPLVQKPNIQGLSGGRLPLPANLDDVQCDFCHVKLPRSIIYMHMKMRHKELMQTAATPPKTAASAKSGNNSEAIQCTPEIVFDDNNENLESQNNASSNNSDLMELNPSSSEIDFEMEQEPDEDPLAGPLAI